MTIIQKGEPMSDLISRQAAIDMLKNRWKKTRNYEGIGDDIAEECELYLKQVPSAQPERAEGEWINTNPEYKNGFYNNSYYCSECHDYYTTSPYEMKFCPSCGADMRGGESE